MSTEQITIRLPVERVAELRDRAKTQHRSLAGEVEHRLSHLEMLLDSKAMPFDPANLFGSDA